MTKKSPSIISKIYPLTFVLLLILGWWALCAFSVVPAFMLPSPGKVASALVTEFPALLSHAKVSLTESILGLTSAVSLAVITAVLMDRFAFLRLSVYPVVVLTQTIPTIAIAPLLVLWLGYSILPKVVLIFITCFFPMVISMLAGLASADKDIIRLFQSMGASRMQILCKVKLPSSIDNFFSGLRVSAAYSIVGAVIAEWLGGNSGLGVYMTRVRKSYAFDKMFAVIIFISLLSLILMKLVDLAHKKATPWKK